MEKTDEFAFSTQVAMATFTGDEKLFVLTSDQTGYLLEPVTKAVAPAAVVDPKK